MGDLPQSTESKGTFFTPEEKVRYTALLTAFDPTAAVNRLDTYGKWLFGSSAVVGGLAAGFSNPSLSKLHGWAMWLFALSVGIFGLSLVFTSWSIAPHWATANIYEPASLEAALAAQMKSRKMQLRLASILFAIALLGAALCPVASLQWGNPVPLVHYSVDDKGAFTASLVSSDEAPKARLEFRLEASGKTLTRSDATPGPGGDVDLSISFPQASLSGVNSRVDLVGCRDPDGKSACEELFRFQIKPA